MSGADDRRTKRALVHKDVVINGVIKAEALDISMMGCISTPSPVLSQGQFLRSASR